MIELACKDAVFHFNKKHLEDSTIPPWVIKCKGKTYYVNHVTANIPWSTKETPANDHTKGAIKLVKTLLIIDDNNNATFSPLTKEDEKRLKPRGKNYTRILFNTKLTEIKDFLKKSGIGFTKIKTLYGSCGRSFDITDIKNQEDMAMLSLTFTNSQFRILQENEDFFKAYDNDKIKSIMDMEDEYYEEYDDEDDED